MQVTIIGGGVIGLCTAYYLRKTGFEVRVIDRGTIAEGCSFGNMGYVSPSHFIPLASPGIIAQGLRWMLSSSSPFYIRPRFDRDLLRWAYHFRRSAKRSTLEKNIRPLNDLLQLSRELMNDIHSDLNGAFAFVEKGCWMLYKQAKTGEHEKQLAEQAATLGLSTRICSAAEVQELETQVEVNVAGGVLYKDDCHVDPSAFMRAMYAWLQKEGVQFWVNSEVKGFTIQGDRITGIMTSVQELPCDEVVLANGSWLGLLGKETGMRLPLQPGKGYSFDYNHLPQNLQYPSILVDDRTATSPIGSWLRIGGTMELSGHDDRILPRRVQAIYSAFKKYYPKMDLAEPDPQKAWFGYRPVTPDGLPYIGRHDRYVNVSFAGGHAMLGVSAAAATGSLVTRFIQRQPLPFSIDAFNPRRFG